MAADLSLPEWVESYLPDQYRPVMPFSLQPLSGDAGFRTYYRVSCHPTLLAVSAPPEHENNEAFVNIALLLKEQGVHAPQIIAVDFARGYLLLEDFGDQLLLPLLNEKTVDVLYTKAESTLLSIQQIDVAGHSIPIYDHSRLLSEMNLFPEWFVTQLLGVELSGSEQQLMASTFEILVESALSQPAVLVHRDYHSRNLMLLGDSDIGVIDFQDAVTGPFTYDLVSLLRDCYIRWPAGEVSRRALNYYRRAVAAGIATPVSDKQFFRWFDLMGLQRHIKVLGIFARLFLRDGKAGYLNDLPLVIRYTLEQLDSYSELKDFRVWLEQRVLPVAESQSWYQPWQQAGDSQRELL